MRISIIAVGTRMPDWVTAGVEQYDKRMPRELNVRWCEIPLARRGKDANTQQLCEREGEQMLKAVGPGDRIIALDVKGRRMSTPQLAQTLTQWQMSGDNYSVLIGGPDGLSAQCLSAAQQAWSLSDLTLPHPLVRVLLAEQLYRAWTITVNHPYHRE
tara:strand:- start:15732 stop:16202 length:471 start_codon:yes stop_codon:yes gene_type:complete